MAGGDFGEVGREDAAHTAKKSGFWLDGRDGAERDEFVAIEADAGIVIFEEFLGWREEAAVGAPEILENWRYGAVVHVAGEDKIERLEDFLDARIGQKERGMSNEDFGFLGGKLCKAILDGVEFVAENVEVFAAFVGVFAIVGRGQSEAKYEMVFIFEFGVI